MQNILIVCVGNICRSPVAAALLRSELPGVGVSSAGVAAVVGADVDETARSVAEEAGVAVGAHEARQFTPEIGGRQDLILVLESGHKREIERIAPHLSGRVMKLGHWTGGIDIPDPYRKERPVHEDVFRQVREATKAWAARLSPTRGR